jgi:hypothetical protein
VNNDYVCDDAESSGGKWRKSSRSYGSGECIEVAATFSKCIAVRDSKNVQGTVLSFSSAQWNAFVARVRSGTYGRVRTEAQGSRARTVPARSSVSRPGMAWSTASPQAVCLAVAEIARVVSLYGCSLLSSSLGYA